uniref:Uncharacterized protein n=1 Tax=Myotis myotis TaxID=51298 RepID=A0A7J7XHJ3_MYOMY|nr:hypothetical protein mMyoMyo1_011737 [Myotis myotis]
MAAPYPLCGPPPARAHMGTAGNRPGIEATSFGRISPQPQPPWWSLRQLGPSSSHLGQPAGGDLLVWLLSTLPGEPGRAPKALLLSAQGQHLSSEQGHGRLCAAWGRGPQRIRQNNLQVARTRSKTAFFPTAQGAFVQTLGSTLTWISDQRCLQTPWPQVTSLF